LPAPGDLEALLAALEKRGLAGEDWTTMVRLLCRACSEGNPDAPPEDHDATCGRRPGDAAAWTSDHTLGIAAASEDAVREALEEWVAAGTGRILRALTRSLDASRTFELPAE
jgi:hypothetical protein